MSQDIWIAAGLSIPISLITGLVVRPVQRWLDTKGQTRAQRKLEELAYRYRQFLTFTGNPGDFQEWLLGSALRGLVGAVFTMVGGFTAIILFVDLTQYQVLHPNSPFGRADKIIWTLTTIVGMSASFTGGFVFSASAEAVRIYKMVQHPAESFKRFPESVRNRGLENEAIRRRGSWAPFDTAPPTVP